MDILLQTACMIFNPIMVDNFAFPINCKTMGRSSIKMATPSNCFKLFQKFGAWLSVSVVGPIVCLFVVFLHSGLRSTLNFTVFVIIYVYYIFSSDLLRFVSEL